MKKARVIAFYLPQYHPIELNNITWGKGFTEWINVVQARPLFRGHYQPKLPADLGFYDLRLPEIREAQAEMARDAGIEGFMYWHYWMGNGKRLLERPFNEVLMSGQPSFPFCLGWANHSWSTKTWTKGKCFSSNKIIVNQIYEDAEGIKKHFHSLLKAFQDERYLKVDGKPIFLIYDPLAVPNMKLFISIWNDLALTFGLNGIHFIAAKHRRDFENSIYFEMGFNGINNRSLIDPEYKVVGSKLIKKIKSLISFKTGLLLQRYNYADIIKYLGDDEDYNENVYPTIIPGYDRTPRSGKKSVIYYNNTPELFGQHVEKTLEYVKNKKDENKIIFLKSWNEWGEGNYMEPDLKYGNAFLIQLKKKLVNED